MTASTGILPPLVALAVLYILYLLFVKPNLGLFTSPARKPFSSLPFESVKGQNFGTVFSRHPYTYILDVRSGYDFNMLGVLEARNIIVLHMPLREGGLLERLFDDSRFHTMCENSKELFVIGNCTDGREVCEKLVVFADKFGFAPVHILEGLERIPHKYLRINIKYALRSN